MAATHPLRVGIVGAGANTRSRHIPGLQAIAGVEVVCVCNRTPASSRAVAEHFGIPRTAAGWPDLVVDPEVDAVVVGTWPYLHRAVTVAALGAGKHVLCEARMAMDLADARKMLEAEQGHPACVAQLVPSPFSLHVDATIRRLVDSGALGGLISVDVIDHHPGFPDIHTPMHWREDRALSGLNTMGLGIWYEALMRWVGGADSLTAFGAVVVAQRVDAESGQKRKIDIPDWLTVTAHLRCGAIAHFSLRQAGGLVPRREAILTGTDASLRFDGSALWLGRRGDDQLRPVEVPSEERAEWRVEAEFVDAIRGVAPVKRTTFADGTRYMAFTQAVEDSRRNGRAETVPEV